jgi:hypothetical protein
LFLDDVKAEQLIWYREIQVIGREYVAQSGAAVDTTRKEEDQDLDG